MTDHNYNELIECYGILFEPELLEEIRQKGTYHSVAAHTVILDYGDKINAMPLLTEGAIKILRQDRHGDELAVYYLERGDTCSMTVTCSQHEKKSVIRAIAETEVRYIAVPSENNMKWIQQYDSWLKYVFESYNHRFDELLNSVDELAFDNMGDRLRKYLKDQVLIKKTRLLDISHQDIAYDMHSSRVVISRLLKKLENEKIIHLKRNMIEMLVI
jgi:CRP/FNR family transcriptional regulator